jgi:hypothetical protein
MVWTGTQPLQPTGYLANVFKIVQKLNCTCPELAPLEELYMLNIQTKTPNIENNVYPFNAIPYKTLFIEWDEYTKMKKHNDYIETLINNYDGLCRLVTHVCQKHHESIDSLDNITAEYSTCELCENKRKTRNTVTCDKCGITLCKDCKYGDEYGGVDCCKMYT